MSSAKAKGAAVVAVSWSHDRPRTELRRPSDGGTPPLPSADTAPIKDAVTGRFLPGNRAHRRRRLKQRAQGVSTLDPTRCESWLSPHVRDGAAYAMELLNRFADPTLARLVGATADANTVFRGMLALGAAGDTKALAEARAWLREHRACLRELAALSGLADSTTDDDDEPFVVQEESAG